MKKGLIWLLLNFYCLTSSLAQTKEQLISKEDLFFLEGITRAVLDTSRIHPGQSLPDPFGKNNTGGTLIRPGGRSTYPSFWIRDYAMSLETGFVKKEEQKHMLWLTAATQCDQTWITKGGSMVPLGAIADHIRVDDSLPIYFPGTYDHAAQGTAEYGTLPPYCDQFFFIHMAHFYVQNFGTTSVLLQEIKGTRLIDRLEQAFKVPPCGDDQLVLATDTFRGVDFGFRDAITITGRLSFPSILKYQAAVQLSSLFQKLKNKAKAGHYEKIAGKIKAALPALIDGNGMLKASDGKSAQADVWSTAIAIYMNILDRQSALKASSHLAQAYLSGKLAYKGAIRHIIHGEDFNKLTAWEQAIPPLNQYQNGAYWHTPTGWVALAIARVNANAARKLIKEFIQDLKDKDFRKGANFGAPYECFNTSSYAAGPVYLTSVSCPFIVLKTK
ncbi:hypothetical protein [Pedobacter nyackensis]|uniref:hypothetical protein n=1 Tax=Pedobacter nyackensis TaxID=475255 RepID=UPI0029318E42|nr:hypothetical protein [Pedobacter nyackensis]